MRNVIYADHIEITVDKDRVILWYGRGKGLSIEKEWLDIIRNKIEIEENANKYPSTN